MTSTRLLRLIAINGCPFFLLTRNDHVCVSPHISTTNSQSKPLIRPICMEVSQPEYPTQWRVTVAVDMINSSNICYMKGGFNQNLEYFFHQTICLSMYYLLESSFNRFSPQQRSLGPCLFYAFEFRRVVRLCIFTSD